MTISQLPFDEGFISGIRSYWTRLWIFVLTVIGSGLLLAGAFAVIHYLHLQPEDHVPTAMVAKSATRSYLLISTWMILAVVFAMLLGKLSLFSSNKRDYVTSVRVTVDIIRLIEGIAISVLALSKLKETVLDILLFPFLLIALFMQDRIIDAFVARNVKNDKRANDSE